MLTTESKPGLGFLDLAMALIDHPEQWMVGFVLFMVALGLGRKSLGF